MRKRTGLRTWIIGRQEFRAYTRSEARALAKKQMGMKRRQRLPRETMIKEKR